MATKASTLLKKANVHYEKMFNFLNRISVQLSEHLEGEFSVCHQSSDGWVVVWDDGKNSKITFDDLDKLLKLPKDEAVALLEELSI